MILFEKKFGDPVFPGRPGQSLAKPSQLWGGRRVGSTFVLKWAFGRVGRVSRASGDREAAGDFRVSGAPGRSCMRHRGTEIRLPVIEMAKGVDVVRCAEVAKAW